MKEILIIICSILLTFDLNGQIVYDFEKEKAQMVEVVEFSDITKEEAYERAKIWMTSNLKSSDQQIFSDDEKNESLIGTGNLHLADKVTAQQKIINYKMSIFFKDGRFKLIVSELVYSYVAVSLDQTSRTSQLINLNKNYEKIYSKKAIKKKKLYIEIDEAFIKLLESLNKAVLNETPANSDDW